MIKRYSFKAIKHISNNYNNSDHINKNIPNYHVNLHLFHRISYIYRNSYKRQFIQNR